MLVRSVPERALGALLGSELVAGVLHQHLAKLPKAISVSAIESSTEGASRKGVPAGLALRLGSLRKDLCAAIQADIDQRTGSSNRLNESQMSASMLCEPPFLESAEIPALDELTSAILVNAGGELHLRDMHVQRYAELLSELDPTVLVAWHLVKRAERSGQGRQAPLLGYVERLTTLFVGPRFLSLPFADNHVHLNGIVGDEFVLAQLVLGDQWPSIREPHEARSLLRLRRIRRSLVVLIDVWGKNDGVEALVPNERLVDLLEACRDNSELATPNPTINWDFMELGIVTRGGAAIETEHSTAATADESKEPISSKWLLLRLVAAMQKHDLQRAWIWLFILLLRTYRASNATPVTRAIILLAVAEIMVLRRELVMDGSGLRRFTTQFFHSTLRKGAAVHEAWHEASLREKARRLFVRPGDKAEIKICAKSLEASDTTVAFARATNAHFQTLTGLSEFQRPHKGIGAGHAHSRSQWHFCAHFNRVADSSRIRLWKQAETLHGVLHSANTWDLAMPFQDSSGIGLGHCVLPAEVIRGLDVAGDETRWPVEMFAPMLRWLRSTAAMFDPLNELIGSRGATPKLHLSVHAGEDYAHPLSGLRHIDEVVAFCEMRAGDRLGHALALGIPPDEWLHRHGEVMLSVDEHVDNLVWAWRKVLELRHLKEARRVRLRLESRITRMLPHVSWYPGQKGAPVPTLLDLKRLHEAWELRRNCAHMTLQNAHTGIGDLKLEVSVPDLAQLSKQVKNPSMSTAEGLYVLRARHYGEKLLSDSKMGIRQVRLTVMRHGHVTRAQQRLESLDKQDSAFLYDHDDAHDLRFMLALQDACIERYARLGLSIETSPSSNVYIGQLQTHSDHPIYRWNPPNRADLDAGGRFNQFKLRTQPMPVTINTDDPGMIPTTLRMEHHLMHEAALDRGHPKGLADEWIKQLRQLGIKHFDDVH